MTLNTSTDATAAAAAAFTGHLLPIQKKSIPNGFKYKYTMDQLQNARTLSISSSPWLSLAL